MYIRRRQPSHIYIYKNTSIHPHTNHPRTTCPQPKTPAKADTRKPSLNPLKTSQPINLPPKKLPHKLTTKNHKNTYTFRQDKTSKFPTPHLLAQKKPTQNMTACAVNAPYITCINNDSIRNETIHEQTNRRCTLRAE